MPASSQPVPIERLLRQTSFNIRGKPPTYEEYLAVEGEDDIPESMLDAFIADDAYRLQMRRFHESISWTTVESLQFGTTLIMLAPFTIAPGVEVGGRVAHLKSDCFSRCAESHLPKQAAKCARLGCQRRSEQRVHGRRRSGARLVRRGVGGSRTVLGAEHDRQSLCVRCSGPSHVHPHRGWKVRRLQLRHAQFRLGQRVRLRAEAPVVRERTGRQLRDRVGDARAIAQVD